MARVRRSEDAAASQAWQSTPQGLAASLVVPLVMLVFWEHRRADALAAKLTDVEHRLSTYKALEARSSNTYWQEEIEAAKQRRFANESSSIFVNELFDTPSRRFPHGHDTSDWNDKLRRPHTLERWAQRTITRTRNRMRLEGPTSAINSHRS